MASKRKSFLIHIDSLDILDDLTDEQAGQLFKAMKAYQSGEDLELSPIVKIAFSPFKNQFARDDEKYQKTCEARAAAGSKGGKQKQQNLANASKSKQEVANVAENKNKSVSKNKSDSNKEKLDWSATQMSAEEIQEIKRIRKSSKADVSQRVINQLAKQFELSRRRGFTNDDILNEWSIKGWRSYKDEWMKAVPSAKPKPQEPVNYDIQQDFDLL